jgi:osomolarity two-component system sensor histidine kinase NIK1
MCAAVFVSFCSFVINLLCAVKWCLDNSISAAITSPISEPDLATAIITALESNIIQPDQTAPDVVYRILLAEDNVVNQRVATKMLERYGHFVEIANNGHEAVNYVKKNVASSTRYDVILVSYGSMQAISSCHHL